MSISERQIFDNLARDLLADGTPFVFIARGRSMAPFISDGDCVVINPCNSEVSVGDVVLLRSGDAILLLHRIIKKTRDGVVTRGDACLNDDGMSRYQDIIGKASKVEGRKTSPLLFFPLGYLLSLVLRLRTYPWVFHPLSALFKKAFSEKT
jgi:signal peptidase I